MPSAPMPISLRTDTSGISASMRLGRGFSYPSNSYASNSPETRRSMLSGFETVIRVQEDGTGMLGKHLRYRSLELTELPITDVVHRRSGGFRHKAAQIHCKGSADALDRKSV